MSNFDPTNNPKPVRNRPSSQGLKEQVTDAAGEMKQRATDALEASSDLARDKFKEATDAAKGVASETVDHIQDRVGEQQHAGADYIARFADNIREAAHAFDNEAPFAARGINSAADYVEEAAEKMRNGSFRDLVDGATDFARQQPAAFLGLSVLVGFAAVRFLKASGRQSSSERNTRRSTPSSESFGAATTPLPVEPVYPNPTV
jgi:hypothetical protein